MRVELGNVSPKDVNHSDPCVTYVTLSDEDTFNPSVDVAELRAHLSDSALYNDGVTHRPDDEALLDIVSPSGVWAKLSNAKPSWVDSDNADMARILGEWFDCPVGKPADVEDTHWTNAGAPGVQLSPGPTALLVNSGNDIVSRTLGGLIVGFNQATATATSSSSLTATGTPFVSSAYIGCVVVATGSSGAYGVIESNSTSVLTIDRWYNPATPGGAAASTPSGTTTYIILSGGPAAWFMALSSTNSAPAAGDTTMAGEITTSGGGLIRALATYAHTASASTYTLANTFTANGTDSLPVTIYRIGTFISMISGWAGSMMLETTLNASATLTTSGDNVTVTDTITV
jgi:hypothetical protein